MRELAVAEDQRGHVDRGEAAAVQGRGDAVPDEGQAEHRDRVQARRRQRGTPQQPAATEAEHQARRHPDGQLERHGAEDRQRAALLQRAGRDQRHQDDGGGVVQPGLRLEGADEPFGQRHDAQHREHRGRVRGRGDRTEQDRQLPGQSEQVVRAHGDHAHRHGHAEGRQGDPEPHRRADLRPGGGETALGEDHRERREAERVRELGVLEVDPEAGLAEGDAHQEVDQQARQARARGHPDGQDREQGDRGTDQHERVELMDVEGHGSARLCSVGWPLILSAPNAVPVHSRRRRTFVAAALGDTSRECQNRTERRPHVRRHPGHPRPRGRAPRAGR